MVAPPAVVAVKENKKTQGRVTYDPAFFVLNPLISSPIQIVTLVSMQTPLSWKKIHFVYSLANLLPLLKEMGELEQRQIQWITARAREVNFSLNSSQGLDFLLQLKAVRAANRATGRQILSEEDILRAIGEKFGLEYKKIDYLELDLEVCTKTISKGFARKNLLVPLRIQNGLMELLVFNPFQPELWADMQRVTLTPYKVFLGTRTEIQRLIDDFFQFRLAIQAAEIEFGTGMDLGNLESKVQVSGHHDPHSHKHIIKAVDYLLRSALRERASDIHLEPKRKESWVRFRIDGLLHTLYRLPLTVHKAMLSRIKTLARMDIAEKRRPQDGRFQIVLQSIPTEVRISTIPVAFGEKMVLRLLSSETTLMDLSQLGMDQENLQIFHELINQTNGLILVTGPTGSGKSTTLYSTLQTLSRPEINIVTIEDPIEMVVDDFNQIGIQPRIGITFSSALRNILRQDPDIIMVGEIRDLETARYAVQSALTGHLVFSTLHTNDAASAITRMIDLGLEPYLINASLKGIIAQRLLRCLCPECKFSQKITPAYLATLGLNNYLKVLGQNHWQARGCVQCRRTGFLNRTGIFEIVPLDNTLKGLIGQGADLKTIKAAIKQKEVATLLEAGLKKAAQGITSLAEVVRVTGNAV